MKQLRYTSLILTGFLFLSCMKKKCYECTTTRIAVSDTGSEQQVNSAVHCDLTIEKAKLIEESGTYIRHREQSYTDCD